MVRYELENKTYSLEKTISVGNQSINSREAVLLHLDDESGVKGIGELSPLPGLSKTTIESARKSLEKLLTLEGKEIDLDRVDFNRYLFGFSCMPVPTEVQFAFESAILDLLIKKKDNYTSRFLSLDSFTTPPVNILIDDLKHLDSYEGINTVKLKIGRKNRTEEINFINELTKMAPYTKLRLDGNRCFSINETVEFAKKIDLASVEYFEEPFDIKRNIDRVNSLNLRLAIDESFNKNDNEYPTGICAVVLKPSNYLSVSGTISYINRAKIPTIISHCYNGPHGMQTLSLLAWYNNRVLELPGLHHGINS